MEDKPINGRSGWSILMASVIASMMGSGSGVYAYMQSIGPQQLQSIARPDPATGSDLRRLKEDVQRHKDQHPDAVNLFERRITRLEAQIEQLTATADEIKRDQKTILLELYKARQ